jgi:hypothetical protein
LNKHLEHTMSPAAADLQALVHAATLAPSSPNTLPWLFRIDGSVIGLLADRTRVLPVNDPELPTFGLPCPTTIFTIGLLALAPSSSPRAVLAVPILWCLVGSQAAFLLDVAPDFGLLAAGVAAIALFAWAAGAQKAPPAIS